MMCVTSVHYVVVVNSNRVKPTHTWRGLRQGGPLYPYLFILVVEGLSALIYRAVSRGYIHDIQICRKESKVSHILFADDCFMFYGASLSKVIHLMELLRVYVKASGQEINMTKYEVFLNCNISRPAQEDLARIIGVCQVLGTNMYLGLPSLIGRSKKG